MGRALRDVNRVPTLIGVSSVNGTTPLLLEVNPTTGELLVTGGGTQYADADVSATPTGTVAMGTDGSNVYAIATDTSGHLQVDVLSGGGGGVQYTEADTDASITGTVAMMEVAADTLQPIQGTVAGGLLVNLGSNNDISGTVTANLSATDNTVLDNIDTNTDSGAVVGDGAAATAQRVHLADEDLAALENITVISSGTVTNAGTFAVQVDGSALTALQLIDDAVAADAQAYGKGILVQGDDGTDRRAILVGTDGHVQVDVLSAPSTAVTNAGITTIAGAVAGTEMQVDVLTMPTTAVTGTFYQATQPVSLASVPSHAVTNAGTFVVQENGAALTALQVIDNIVSGSEAQVDVVAALPAGTNALGKLLPPDIDITTHTNYIKKYYTNAGAVTDGIIWSPAAGKRWHITTLYINTSAAATITLEDDLAGGDSPVWKGELAANSGVVIPFSDMYPFASGEDAADLIITTSAGNVYVSCVGYEI